MKVSEMIEWLKTQDQDLIVEVLCTTKEYEYVYVDEIEFDSQYNHFKIYEKNKRLVLGCGD